MDYYFTEFTINQIVSMIDKDQIDLNPSYQRNFIWSTNDQKQLIDTILLGYPLPNFFIYEKENRSFEMVDGQQRSKTIYKFIKGQISSSKITGNRIFENQQLTYLLDYKLPIVVIRNITNKEVLNQFYVLINKKGLHLNPSEIYKAEFADSLFLKLANDCLTYQNLIELDLFSESSSKRMTDRAFIEELLAYLKLGIREKKKIIHDIYEEDISEEEFDFLKGKFCSIIDVIAAMNKIAPIKNTRYKQKNDFYTLFSFIDKNLNVEMSVLIHQYRILLILDKVDNEGRQFVRPTNEDCSALREYANNCVAQSNSKIARDNRLQFFNAILKNENKEYPNEQLVDVLRYLGSQFGDDKIDLVSINGFYLLDVEKI